MLKSFSLDFDWRIICIRKRYHNFKIQFAMCFIIGTLRIVKIIFKKLIGNMSQYTTMNYHIQVFAPLKIMQSTAPHIFIRYRKFQEQLCGLLFDARHCYQYPRYPDSFSFFIKHTVIFSFICEPWCNRVCMWVKIHTDEYKGSKPYMLERFC